MTGERIRVTGIVQGVGYPDASRSHFTSTDVWQSASTDPEDQRDGWLGRALDRCATTRTTSSAPSVSATSACASLVTAVDSPVSSERSRVDEPSTTTPSAGIESPARTSTTEPFDNASRGTSRTASPSTSRATDGASENRSSVELAALSCCRRWRKRPTRRKKISAVTESK